MSLSVSLLDFKLYSPTDYYVGIGVVLFMQFYQGLVAQALTAIFTASFDNQSYIPDA